MLRNKKSGFTLIELMVVIVIIGVLAGLAVPKYTEVAAKGKMAEAPKIIASYETAYLAAQAEGRAITGMNDLSFKMPQPGESKWWNYDFTAASSQGGDTFTATASKNMGKFKGPAGTGNNATGGDNLTTEYIAPTTATSGTGNNTTTTDVGDCFKHNSSSPTVAKDMLPNFFVDRTGANDPCKTS